MEENNKLSLPTDSELDALEWAKEFMNGYERKHKLGKYNQIIPI